MSEQKGLSLGKKTYTKPSLTLKPLAEVATLLRQKALDQHQSSGGPMPDTLNDVPILFVEGYEGDVALIGYVRQLIAPHLRHSSIFSDNTLIEIQLDEREGATSPAIFLLLDLRNRTRQKWTPPVAIGTNPNLSDTTPIVILASSVDDFHCWGHINPTLCWQLKGPLNSVELVMALRSFLKLCAALEKIPKEEILSSPTSKQFSGPVTKGG